MSYHFIDKKDPRIDMMFQGLEKMEKMLARIEDAPNPSSRGTVSTRTRNFPNNCGISRTHIAGIPYFRGDSLLHGTRKALYKESDIMKILDDAYKRCREEQRWV